MRFFASFFLICVSFYILAAPSVNAGWFGFGSKDDAEQSNATVDNAKSSPLSGVFEENPGEAQKKDVSTPHGKTLSDDDTGADADVAENNQQSPQKLTKADRVKYTDITRASLSQMFWAMGAYDTSNDTDVDNFLLLNRCDLYQDFYRDDFKWHKVRVQAKASLEKNVKSFPTRLKMIQPIWLKRYSFQQQAFPLSNPFSTSRFELEALDHEEWDCKKYAPSKFIWKYPSRAEITFSTPIEVEQVDVTPEVAKLYNKLYSDMKLHTNRPAYIVIYFKVYEADPVPSKRGFTSKTGKILAVAEKIEFYGDYDLRLHLSTLDFRRRNKSRFSGENLTE